MELLISNLSRRTRRARWKGREYLVAPMSLLNPGVLNGSNGPLYYPKEEVYKNPGSWEDMPIVVYHPEVNGVHVSARDPDILSVQGIGFVRKPSANGKLRAEGWFDIEATRRVDSRVLEALQQNRTLELSTGLFTDNEPTSGSYLGRGYTGIARNYRPDHLAILPDKIGACSINDGCGVNVNHSPGGKGHDPHVKNACTSCGPSCDCDPCKTKHRKPEVELEVVNGISLDRFSLSSVVNHTPGGKGHDQKKHGKKGIGSRRLRSKDSKIAKELGGFDQILKSRSAVEKDLSGGGKAVDKLSKKIKAELRSNLEFLAADIPKGASVSMTKATESIFGMSGRGSPTAKRKLRSMASFGVLKIVKKGRSEKVSITDLGFEMLKDEHLDQTTNRLFAVNGRLPLELVVSHLNH